MSLVYVEHGIALAATPSMSPVPLAVNAVGLWCATRKVSGRATALNRKEHTVIYVDLDSCVGCGGCISGYDGLGGCPAGAIHLEASHAVIDQVKCIECGRCIQLCALDAVKEQ